MLSNWYSKPRHCYIFCCYNFSVALCVAEYDRKMIVKSGFMPSDNRAIYKEKSL
ncbi:hypothetical protein HMPREF1990_00470 [Porphyromonas gingivalis W4087]|nr:hypothetical protein HMPREF1553_00121 [Porphyromonas gingivalis F0568]ERJ85682.1 hypothetical protein HMPREF1988_00347 [Porphyromonas gingivalis F0185]ERJ90848.1 hypothetical protein HMPREF1990_00470 [Porphyromonas gingivalis W4087]